MPRTTIATQREEAKGVANRLRWARELEGLTPTQLAADAGVETTTIYHVERGHRLPSIHLLMALCQILKISPQYLLWGTLEGIAPEKAATLKLAHPELRWPSEPTANVNTNNSSPNNVDPHRRRARHNVAIAR